MYGCNDEQVVGSEIGVELTPEEEEEEGKHRKYVNCI